MPRTIFKESRIEMLSDEAARKAAEDIGLAPAFADLNVFRVLLHSPKVAKAVGDLLLGFCERCGFIQNVRFEPRLVDYSKPTEESQAFSSRFQLFAEDLADQLVAEHDLRGKTVLEVGCGKGDFLALLAERGIARGVGIDSLF